jgi:hypothetical protein
MKKFLFVMFFLFYSINAYCDDRWIYISSTDSDAYYFDNKTKTDNEVWLKMVSINKKQKYSYILTKRGFNCNNKTMWSYSFIVYDKKSEIVFNEISIKNTREIAPDTIGETILGSICGRDLSFLLTK